MTTLANVCNKIVKCCLYTLIFLLPLFYLPFTLETVEFNKQNLLIILSLVAGVAWLGKMAASKKVVWRKSFFNLLALFYLGVYFFSALLGNDKFRGFIGSSGGEKNGFLTLFCFILFYFVLINNIEELREIKKFIFTFLLGSFLVSLFSLFGILKILPLSLFPNWTGNTVGSLTALGIFSAISFVLASAMLFKTYSSPLKPESIFQNIFLFVLSLLSIFTLVIIDSQMAWASLIIGTIIVLALIVIKAPEIKNLAWSALPILALLLGIILFFVRTPINLNLPAEISPSFSSSIRVAQKTLEKNPLLGSGPGTFIFDYNEFKAPEINKTPFWNIKFEQSSSRIITLLATTGLIGIVSLLFLLIYLAIKSFIDLVKEKGDFWPMELAIVSAWTLLLAAKFLYSSNLTLEFSFWFLSGLLVISISHKFWETSLKQDSRTSLIISFFLSFGAIILISIFYLTSQRYVADFATKKALALSDKGGAIEEVSDYFNVAVSKNRWNDLYFKNFSQSLLLYLNKELNLEPNEERTQKIQSLTAVSIDSAKKAIALSPNNSTNYSVLASVYQSVLPFIGDADAWAIDTWQKAIALEPNNPVFYNELGKVYITIADLTLNNGAERPKGEVQKEVRENLAKAEEQFNKAIELKNDFVPAHFQLSLVYGRQGKTKEAISKLESMRYSLPSDIGVSFQLGLLYYQNKETDKAIAELKRTLELAPKFANAHWYLAAIYEEKGDNELAIIELKKILNDDSENKTVKDKIEMLRNKPSAVAPLPTPLPAE
jgi:tetratricopeptide (TPR) repeat protein